MPPKRGAKGGKAYQLAKPLPPGEVMTDILKKRWILGAPIGQGGFGLIYLAAPESEKNADDRNARYVIKLEPHENGPLFTELAFYLRVAKPEKIAEWKATHPKVSHLGVPEYVGSGNHTNSSVHYRFMVMQRFGKDLEKIFTECGRRFSMPTICYLALRMLDSLEYLHDQGYVHADIKASNLLTGHKNKHEVYLVDYGLAVHYITDGRHRTYKEDPRKAHNGTVEFTSRDAHNGVDPSRRGDLEILGYCLLQWASGKLPWEDKLTDKQKVAREKTEYMKKPASLVKACFQSQPAPKCLTSYLEHISGLAYERAPDYALLRQLFHRELASLNCNDEPNILDWVLSKPKPTKKRRVVDDVDSDELPIRKKKTPPRATSLPTSRAKKVTRPSKKKTAASQPADDNNVDDKEPVLKLPSPLPLPPPPRVVKKTTQPVRKKPVSPTSPLAVRRSPRAHKKKPTVNEVLAEKMKIGASIIPGAVTVPAVSKPKGKRRK